jgi:ubiquinone/menaquinone biosynthesis C-methylase UbiE
MLIETVRALFSYCFREFRGLDRSPGNSYSDEVASNYLGTRPDWAQEQDAVEGLLDSLPNGLSCLDIPVGPGRFLGKYKEKCFTVTGLDLSADMLAIASKEAASIGSIDDVRLGVSDVTKLPFADNEFDLCVSTRFLDGNITYSELRMALAELSRVTRGKAIFHLTYRTRAVSVPLRSNRVIAGRLTEDKLLSLLASFGFIPISSVATVVRETSTAVMYLLVKAP